MQNYNCIANIRVIATLFIVFYHCCCPYTVWIGYEAKGIIHNDSLYWFTLEFVYDSMLPTFFMISGMIFYGKKDQYSDRVNTFWKKVDRLLIPMCILTCINLLLGIDNPMEGHLWFLKVLFVYYIITLLLYNVSEYRILILSFILHLVYMYSVKLGVQSQMPEEIWRGLRYYIYFVLGHFANVYFFRIRSSNKFKIIMIFIAILSLIFNSKIYVQFVYSIVFNILLICFTKNSDLHNHLWRSINGNSFGIYLLHHPIIISMLSIPGIQTLYTQNFVVSITIMFAISLLLSWTLSVGLHKVGFKYF